MKRYLIAAALAATSSCAFAVFQTRGELSVSDSGSLGYVVPIAVPPGVGGMEPKLSLTYNSQGGNGFMGMGWSVSGLTAISRCPKTIVQDTQYESGVTSPYYAGAVNYTQDDRFCMDGQRLMMVSGSAYGAQDAEYRTELESYAKTVSLGGSNGDPQSFKVWTKSGQIIEYGNTLDSRAEAFANGPARIWMVNRITDTKGNSIEFVYEEDAANGEQRPKQINYTLNPAAGLNTPMNSVVFHYELRPDTVLGFHNGYPVRTTQRISKLELRARGKTVREYRFTYETGNGTEADGNFIGTQRSHLVSLQECVVDPSESCLNPTQFEWSTTRPGYEIGPWTTVGQKFHSGDGGKNATGDFNGDGKTDVVSYVGDDNSKVNIHLSNGTGFVSAEWNGQFKTSDASSKNWIGDFNGDGRSDIASWDGQNQISMNLANAEGNGFTNQTWAGSFNDNATSDKNWLGDFNGDGLTDIAAYNGSDKIIINLSTGTDFITKTWSGQFKSEGASHNWLGDFNGDGKTDIASWCCGGGDALNVNLSTGTGFSTSQWGGLNLSSDSGGGVNRNFRGDFNGDGKMDIASWKQGGDLLVMHMSSGAGFVREYWPSNLHESTSNWVGDYNGDGRSDIASWSGDGTKLRMHLSEGTQFRREQWATDLFLDKSSIYHWFGDFDGDGHTDVASRTSPVGVMIDDYSVSMHRAFDISSQGATYPDIITKVTEGLGATQTIEYLPLTDAGVYSKGFQRLNEQGQQIEIGLLKGDGSEVALGYPYVDVQIPLYVVSRVRASNGVGGEMSSRYQYEGLRSHSQGRGLLGFARRTITQEQKNHLATTEYAQVFPHAGMPLLATNTLAGAGGDSLLGQSDMRYGCLDPAGGEACSAGASKRYFPYASSSTEQSWDLNGAALPVTTTSSTYNNWGDVLQVSVTTTNADGTQPYGKTTSNTYQAPDTVRWILGRLQRATVTTTTPDAP